MNAQDDEHFPWHSTEYGVVCACSEPMRSEVCPAAHGEGAGSTTELDELDAARGRGSDA
jgi:hypothetical protein